MEENRTSSQCAGLVGQVRGVIEKHSLIEAGDRVILGLSGGPDSLCLFDVLETLQGELGFTLSCVHVNHGLRPGEAEEDQLFVEEICEARGVECRVFAVDCRAAARSLGLTEEEAGRRLRYGCFAECADALAAQAAAPRIRIAVAQNRNDQAETVLQRLLRGTGTDGLAGMDYLRTGGDEGSGYDIIRPLLDTDREDIEAYLRARGLVPRRDRTNSENTYVRNRIRNELLPYLAEQFNPNITEALTRAAANAREDSQYLKELAEKTLFDAQIAAGEVPLPKAAGSFDRLNMDIDTLLAAPLPVRHRVLRMAFAQIGLVQDIAAVHLAAMDRLLEEGRTSSRTVLPGEYVLRIGYGTAACCAPSCPEDEADGNAKTADGDAKAAEGNPATAAAASCTARVLTREQLLAVIDAENSKDTEPAEARATKALSEEERILSYIYSKNFSGINEAACVLDADKTAALLAVPAEELEARITFRPRRAGDRLPLKDGSKSIQDYMVDEKIPKDRRNRILLAVCDGTVLMVPVGMVRPRCAAGCTAGPETERFLLLEMAMYV